MKRRSRPSFTVLLGSTLVLGLVAALPVSLALFPAETLQCELGPGDLTAAALSSLDRDIQTHRVLTPESRLVTPAFFFLRVAADDGVATAAHGMPTAREERHPALPGSCTPGLTDAMYLLLL